MVRRGGEATRVNISSKTGVRWITSWLLRPSVLSVLIIILEVALIAGIVIWQMSGCKDCPK